MNYVQFRSKAEGQCGGDITRVLCGVGKVGGVKDIYIMDWST